VDVLNNPSAELDADGNRNKDQRPCPVCRAAVDKGLLFTRAAFEPTDKELNPNALDDDSEEEVPDSEMDVDEIYTSPSRKGKGRAVKHSRGAYKGMDDDDYDDEDQDMSDFIVADDEDEDEKDARREMKQRQRAKKLGKRRANVILDSDEEEDEGDKAEVQGVLFGAKSKAQLEVEAMEKMPRFLPSTKMKYMMELILKKFKEKPDEKVGLFALKEQ
jgi:hypothetical protein